MKCEEYIRIFLQTITDFIIFNIFSQCRWAKYATNAKETQFVQIKHNVEYVSLILCDHAIFSPKKWSGACESYFLWEGVVPFP